VPSKQLNKGLEFSREDWSADREENHQHVEVVNNAPGAGEIPQKNVLCSRQEGGSYSVVEHLPNMYKSVDLISIIAKK
jgi:hypothetical protein